ncbi:50S ribosome-binding GTPase [Vibrio kyushuensis]|uniref:GTPase family protein n=1 Tax=Vibrio kyushuensis TaxID=2910249 RepID=UPI003D0CF0AC
MSKWKKASHVLAHLSEGGIGLGIVLAVIPMFIMALFGLFLSFKHGYLIELSISLMLVSVVTLLPMLIIRYKESKKLENHAEEKPDEDFVQASSDWSENEIEIWHQVKQHVDEKLEEDDEWSSLYIHGLGVVEKVAEFYGKKELEFTVPEGLKLLEEVSRRYRCTLSEHVPGIEAINVSHIKWIYKTQDQYGDKALAMMQLANLGRKAYLAYVNPIKLVNDEIRNKILMTESSSRYTALQINAKKALLHEAASVSIDLYSGRFTINDEEVTASSIATIDKHREAPELEPVRIVLVGQTGVGKSSLVNALKDEFSAETDEIPSSKGVTTYNCQFDEKEALTLIDVEGLDGTSETQRQMLEEMINADIVLWVLKANQSSRQLDSNLKQAFHDFYNERKNISKKQPVIVGVLNQVDRLAPALEWSPPYDLDKPTCKKSSTIVAALEYNQSLLEFDDLYALSIGEARAPFGVAALKTRLSQQYSQAKNIQRNRQNREAQFKGEKLITQGKRLFKSAKKMIKHSTIEKEGK